MGKQVIDLRPQKGMTEAQSNEHLRNFSEEAYRKKKTGNFDPTREHLNFEVGKGGRILPVNKAYSIPKRIKDDLESRGIKDPNERLLKAGLEPKYRTVASFILGGSTEDMRRLAFGDQNVDFEKGNDTDNSWVKREKGIEEWAVDVYNFMAKKYGEENIAAFIVHLDEKNPHVHCTILPVTDNNKLSWKKVFSGEESKYEGAKRFRQLHDEFAKVNAKYGLKRGDDIRTSGAKHKEYAEYLREQNVEKKKINDTLDEKIGEKRETVGSLDEQIKQRRTKLRGLTTMLLNLETLKSDLENDIETLEAQRDSIKGDTSAIDAKISVLRKKLSETEEKISMRQKQIIDAQKEYDLLRQHIADSKETLGTLAYKQFEADENLRKTEGKAYEQVKKDIGSIGLRAAAYDAEQRFSQLSQNSEMWTPEQRSFFDNQISRLFSGSVFDTMIRHGEEVVETASKLYLGLLTPEVSGGGGGGGSSSDLRWDGRNKDEDDLSYKLRCLMMGVKMAKGGGSKKKRGISR